MTFDLYGPAAPAEQPKATTIDALAAADWTQLPDGKWQLTFDDHTDYGDGDEEGHWRCWLYVDDGDWIYDFEHCYRGGPQDNNGLDLDSAAPVAVAQAATTKALERWIDRWTDSLGADE